VLNLHERWLLRLVGVNRDERRAVFAVIAQHTPTRGQVDVLAELGGYTLGRRKVRKDLAPLFDRLMSRSQVAASGVAYGDRRYRREVIIAAALHQAGVDVTSFQAGLSAGYRTLDEFRAVPSNVDQGPSRL
jgi:hypothetical protein